MDDLIEFAPLVLSGLWVTVSLSLASLGLAVLFGFAGVSLKLSKARWPRALGTGYTTLIRGIPDLVLMLLFYFGGQIALNQIGQMTGLWDFVEINQFVAGSLTIGFIFGAYMTETFRGAYLALPKGQLDAARALGLRGILTLRLVVLPQLVPLALPSFTNNWLVLLKTTALVSIIGLQDIVYNANQAGRSTQQPFIFLFLAFFVYLGLTFLSQLVLNWLRRRHTRHEGLAHGS